MKFPERRRFLGISSLPCRLYLSWLLCLLFLGAASGGLLAELEISRLSSQINTSEFDQEIESCEISRLILET